jgi:hypothetical protein
LPGEQADWGLGDSLFEEFDFGVICAPALLARLTNMGGASEPLQQSQMKQPRQQSA